MKVQDLFSLSGHAALVTGGGAGIGKAICLMVAEAGADVACTDLREADAEAVAAECRKFGGQAIGLKLDVTNEAERIAVVERAAQELGRLTILVNNAGGGGPKPFDMPLGDFEWAYQINVFALFRLSQLVAPHMKGAGGGAMIADLNGEKAAATAAKIAAETGQSVLGAACDVTDNGQIQACVAETVARLGSLTTLVNIVGWGELNPDPLAVTNDQMIASYKLNTLSALRKIEACGPHLKQARNASITNSGSMVGILPAFDFLAYSSAKAALNHLMTGLAHAFAKQIRVNTVVIGTVVTEGYAAAGLDAKAQERLMHPDNLTGRSGTPQDIANAFLWLASPAGSWVSGQILQVSGGPKRIRLMPED